MRHEIRQVIPGEVEIVSSILTEAADWTRQIGMPLWRPDETSVQAVTPAVEAGLFFFALVDGKAQGTLRFQLSDPPVWPEITGDDSAFVHRLAVRRDFAGTGLSSLMLGWAAARALSLDRRWLRLDCEVGRPRLRAFYESLGFRHRGDAEVEIYRLSRFEVDLYSEAGVQLARRSVRIS